MGQQQRYSWEIAPATNGLKYMGVLIKPGEREVSAYADDIKSIQHYMEWLVSDLNEKGGRS